MPSRRDDWAERLNALRDAKAREPFVWGRWDCAAFGAAAVEALTGEDFYAPFRGRYASARGSVRALRKFGAGTIEATFTAALGQPVHPAFAGDGDIVLGADGQVGVMRANGEADFVGNDPEAQVDGFVRKPRAELLKAWKV